MFYCSIDEMNASGHDFFSKNINTKNSFLRNKKNLGEIPSKKCFKEIFSFFSIFF